MTVKLVSNQLRSSMPLLKFQRLNAGEIQDFAPDTFEKKILTVWTLTSLYATSAMEALENSGT